MKKELILFLFHLFCVSLQVFKVTCLLGCADVPQDCLQKDISFHLFTKYANQSDYELVLQNPNTIEKAPFIPNTDFKVLIHGYSQSMGDERWIQMRKEYLKEKPWNIIQVDYSPLAENGCYIETTFPSARIVGKCCASLLNLIFNKNIAKIEQFHVIGFSIGAQIAAEMSDNLNPRRLPRISGLDPAWPLFYPILTKRIERLGQEHADFVDVLHTNAGLAGVLYSEAHYDIYANDGTIQPGCGISFPCSHDRAIDYFTESINSKTSFIAKKCDVWEWSVTRMCISEKENSFIVVGEHATPPKNVNEEGLYSFETADKSPFALAIAPQKPIIGIF